jgi:xylulokinase
LWCQILADVLESELVSVNTTEGAAFGAALLAGVGKGAWPDVVTACHESIHITGKTTPNPENFEVYQQAYQVYRELYPLLKNTFTKLDY